MASLNNTCMSVQHLHEEVGLHDAQQMSMPTYKLRHCSVAVMTNSRNCHHSNAGLMKKATYWRAQLHTHLCSMYMSTCRQRRSSQSYWALLVGSRSVPEGLHPGPYSLHVR